jgi:DNA-binding FadR family transcriptional regulator
VILTLYFIAAHLPFDPDERFGILVIPIMIDMLVIPIMRSAESQRRSVVDICEQMLRREIISGELEVGAQLPPERELAEQMEVSRLTLRSALTRLAASGLLSVRQGSGYRVQDYLRFGGPDLLDEVVELAESSTSRVRIVADLLAMRRQVARVVLERLSDPAERGSVDEVMDAIERFAAAVEGRADVEEIAMADLGIISAMVQATESPVYALCINPIIRVVMDLKSLRDILYRAPDENLAGYRILQYWLTNPDPKFIGTLMLELVRRDEASVRLLARPKSSP